MATTPAAIGRRYSPLLILAAIQLLLVVLSPSVPRGQGTAVNSLGSGPIASGAAGGAVDPATGQAIDPATGQPIGGAGGAGGAGGGGAGGGAGGGVGGGASGGAGGAAGGVAGRSGGGAGGGLAAGGPADRSHCGPDGKQLSPTFYMPPCAAVFHGDNGGSTMPGVSATTVNYVYYVAQGNAQVNAILAEENLAATNEQTCEKLQAFEKWANKRFELYGRHLNSLDGPGNNKGSVNQSPCKFAYFQGQCSLTPPDPACERAEADVIASMHPAWVMAPVADPALFNQLGKDHVIVAGGYLEPNPDSYHQNLAPYYYDIGTNGDRAATQMAEYYCKKLYNHPVVHAGRGAGDVIPPTGPAPRRKAAIVYPSTNGDPTITQSANLFISLISGKMCGSPSDGVKGYPYQSDINTAEQQSTTTIAALKQNGVTTVVFYGDPIAPVFLSNTADSQGYHPEIMISGTGVVDYDVLGQLYNKNVWKNAFGPSDLGNAVPFSETDAVKAYNDAGYSGQPDGTANVALNYYNEMASAFQAAGPKATPQSIHDGLFSAPAIGGDPVHPLDAYGRPNDYTSIKDAREVYWCTSAISPINGQPGAYLPTDGGRRYQLGQWPSGEPKVFPNGPC
ncbi:MAG: hypothetical protein NVS3B12_08090 [Acidimicrobiales bacterium]